MLRFFFLPVFGELERQGHQSICISSYVTLQGKTRHIAPFFKIKLACFYERVDDDLYQQTTDIMVFKESGFAKLGKGKKWRNTALKLTVTVTVYQVPLSVIVVGLGYFEHYVSELVMELWTLCVRTFWVTNLLDNVAGLQPTVRPLD